MSPISILVAILSGTAYAAYAISAMCQFLSYCEQVALFTGRTRDNADLNSQDDNGRNAFQREQLRMLRSGEFMNYKDAAIVAHGIVVARKLKISFWAAVGIVLSVTVTNQLTM